MHAPPLPVLDFDINEFVLMLGSFEFSVDFSSLFDRSHTLVLAMYTNEFIIAENLKQFMMKMLISKDGMMDKDGWHSFDGVFLVKKDFTLKILKRVQST